MVPVTDTPENPHVLLTRRASHMKTHGGQVAFPGGMRDKADASLLATALRETEEEIGLPSSRVQIIAALSQVSSLHRILVTPYVGIVPEDHPYQADPREIESIFQVPVSFFLEDRRERTDVIPFMGKTLHVPCYRWQDYQIWGLSAVVLVDFLNAAFDAGIEIMPSA